MLYKFKSKASGDVIMLEPHGRRVLEIIGKAPAPQGIVLPEQMADAIQALERAVLAQEAAQKAAVEQAQALGEPIPQFEEIGLRQRTQPFIELLRRSLAESQQIVWGV